MSTTHKFLQERAAWPQGSWVKKSREKGLPGVTLVEDQQQTSGKYRYETYGKRELAFATLCPCLREMPFWEGRGVLPFAEGEAAEPTQRGEGGVFFCLSTEGGGNATQDQRREGMSRSGNPKDDLRETL